MAIAAHSTRHIVMLNGVKHLHGIALIYVEILHSVQNDNRLALL